MKQCLFPFFPLFLSPFPLSSLLFSFPFLFLFLFSFSFSLSFSLSLSSSFPFLFSLPFPLFFFPFPLFPLPDFCSPSRFLVSGGAVCPPAPPLATPLSGGKGWGACIQRWISCLSTKTQKEGGFSRRGTYRTGCLGCQKQQKSRKRVWFLRIIQNTRKGCFYLL